MEVNFPKQQLISFLCLLYWIDAPKYAACFSDGVKIIVMDNKYSNSHVINDNEFGGDEHPPPSQNASRQNSSSDSSLLRPTTYSENHVNSPILCSRYFGAFFAPYVRTDGTPSDDYTLDDVKKMLKVTLTKSRSIMTTEMDYQNQIKDDNGQYNGTLASKIAPAAAQLNHEADIQLMSMSQGATYSMMNHTFQRDFEAALHSAKRANTIYPGTVWAVHFDYTNFILKEHNGTFSKMMDHIQPYSKRIRGLNLKFGLYIYACEDILLLKDYRFTLHDLRKLANLTDFLICTIYPKKSVREVDDYFNTVRSSFELVKKEFTKYAPQTRLYLYTGWASQGMSVYNPPYMNSPQKTKQFWDVVENWSEQTKQRVFMNSAFDYFLHYDDNGVPQNKYYFGYFKRADDNSDKYLIKGTDEIVGV